MGGWGWGWCGRQHGWVGVGWMSGSEVRWVDGGGMLMVQGVEVQCE